MKANNQHYNISKDYSRKRMHQSNTNEIRAKQSNADNIAVTTENLQEQRKNLPIYYGRKELIKAVMHNDTVILMSETGSGKTTQLPQYLLESQMARFGMIVCTQPRRVAAITVADRVAKEKNTLLGDLVGYTVRFEDVTSPKTLLKYVTDGMLLRESLLDSLLTKYSIIILDEAHERSIHTDVLFGIVKHAQLKRKEKNMNKLKIVIMSATLQADNFVKYFTGAHVCYVEGRRHPIKIFYTEEIQKDYLHASLVSAIQIHKENPLGEDILVFLTGQEEIEMLTNLIKEIGMFLPESFGKILVCPLFASLPNNEQIKAFTNPPLGYRKIIISTNIAETSVTIPGIKHVVDCGMVKAKTHNPTTGLEVLKVQPISKAQARQRSGRAGRECAGICYRLYPEKTFEALDDYTVPEIKRCNLRGVLLQLLALGLKDVLKFDFMDSPPQCAIEYALNQLVMLGAVESINAQKITEKGKTMCAFPLDPPLAACILSAHEYGCTEELITIVALMTVESIFYIPPNQRERSKKVLAKFTSTEGDHISMLLFFRAYKQAKGNIQWCVEHFVNIKAIKNVLQIRHQLRDLSLRLNLSIKSCGADYNSVRKALSSGLFMNSAERQIDGTYLTLLQKQTVSIHPSSVLFNSKPALVIFSEVVHTSKRYMRGLSIVDPSWLIKTGLFDANKLIPNAIQTFF
ncbi:ATP-dependent RNA helicase DHX33 [Hydra vulgaris]|uniref:RNA helicase n=1 Tax=Hydra vulgaris TaxID=6087 RepID=A0ABM4DQ99_HYDVU